MAPGSIVGVGYKASPQAIVDLVAGRLQVMVADFATAMPQVKPGKLRVLGVTTAKRSALLPGVPPIADTLKGFDMTSWNGLFAPAGTPQPIVARLAAGDPRQPGAVRCQKQARRNRIRSGPTGCPCVRPLRARAARYLG